VSRLTPPAAGQQVTLPPDLVPVGRAIGRRLGNPHKSTIVRWILRGVRGPDGRRVKLRAWRFGARWMTTPAAAEEFVRESVTAADSSLAPRTMTARRQASEDAEAALRAMGM
jgi:hypothetical protein